LLVRKKKPCILGASTSGRQSVFRIEQNGAGIGRKKLADFLLELHKPFGGNFVRIAPACLCEELAQSAALVNGKRRDDAALVRQGS
jgi:hypothetical protein